jgi:hypothetical protein
MTRRRRELATNVRDGARILWCGRWVDVVDWKPAPRGIYLIVTAHDGKPAQLAYDRGEFVDVAAGDK